MHPDEEERFGLNWTGKRAAYAESQQPLLAEVYPCKEESLHWDATQNLYIEGDNLEAIKFLRRSYTGGVKMIYIDPPYNTGGDLVYRDDFRQRALSDSADRQHSAWCSMMYSRLLLARELLTEDGVIFISIGEQELHTLTCLCDEIFLPENRMPLFSRVTKKSSNNGDHFSPCVDYILIYARNLSRVKPYSVPLPEEIVSRYRKTDEYLAERGPYQEVTLYMAALKHGGSHYAVECPDGTLACPPDNRPWRWNEERFLRGKEEGRIVFKRTKRSPLIHPLTKQKSQWNVYTKMYLHERAEGLRPKNFSDAFPNTAAAADLRKLGIPFDFAKPVSLIAWLVRLQTAGEDVVLDFFSGSATTAHAVMQCNAEDGGRRRFIMVQLPEPTDPKGRAGGFSTICEIGKERIRRAGKALREQFPDAALDIGFRVIKLR